jgi:hypothetical protein
MSSPFLELRRALEAHVVERGIAVDQRELPIETPARFDGVSITLNPRHDVESLAYYLVHSYGSIAGWVLDLPGTRRMFDELREARASRREEASRFETALAAFRAFEERASQYSVATLAAVGHPWAIPSFTLFFRADLEAITQFHREGRAPVWPEFLRRWQQEAAAGVRVIVPFRPMAVPPFTPVAFEPQTVTQERDGRADD